MGIPQSLDALFHGKFHLEIDDLSGYPHFNAQMDRYDSNPVKALLDQFVICEGFVIVHKCLAVKRPKAMLMQCFETRRSIRIKLK